MISDVGDGNGVGVCVTGPLGDFLLRHRLFQGRAIFNGQAIMSPCVHIRRFNSRLLPTIFPMKRVHYNKYKAYYMTIFKVV